MNGKKENTPASSEMKYLTPDKYEERVFNYENVFFSYFYDTDRACVHRIPESAINYVISGEMLITDGEKQISVTKGECVFIPRNIRLTMYKQPKDGERYQGIFLMFKRDFLRRMFDIVGADKIRKETPKLDTEAIKLPLTAELESLFVSITPYFNPENKPSPDIMQLKLQEALLALLHIDQRFAPTLFDFSDPWKIDIIGFLQENYMIEMTTGDMAHYTGRSLAAFKRDFKEVSDLTPEKWLIRKRLEVARNMIEEGANDVADIAYTVGFKNPSHFATAFKRFFGITPSALISTSVTSL